MVDSPKVPHPAVKITAPVPAQAEQSGRIVTLPDALANADRARRVEGTVLQQNDDGSTRVRTPQGDIDIILRKPPERGQAVQVDIPAGRPPRQVTVRPAPPENAQPQQPAQPVPQQPAPARPAPVQTQPAVPQPVPAQPPASGTAPAPSPAMPQQPPVNGTAPPRPVPLPLPQGQTPMPPVGTAPLPENVPVRLLPAPPAQVQAALQQQTAALPAPVQTIVTQAAFGANLIAQSATDNLMTQLLNIVRPVIGAAPTPALTFTPPAANAAAASPLPGAAFLSQATPAFGAPQSVTGQSPLPLAGGTAALTAMPALTLSVAAPFQVSHAFLTPALQSGTAAPLFSAAALPQMDVSIARITPPQAQIVPPAPNSIFTAQPLPASPVTITAMVAGMTAQGNPLLSLTLPGQNVTQYMSLQFPASNLPVGSQVQITPPSGGAALPLSGLPNSSPLGLLGGSRWPVLDEVLQALRQSDPAMAQALGRAMPSPGSPRAMPAAALLFIAAAKVGDLSLWLGDKKTEALQRIGRGSLLGRLNGDGQQMSRLSAEPLSGSDWRAVPLPMFWDNEIHKVAIYFKRDGDEAARDSEDGEQTRFIFDLSLSRIGEMQIDGLMRGTRFDLIVRTQSPFSSPMMTHMKQLYASAIGEVNLTGDLSFQGDARQWVNVLQQDAHYGANI